MAQTRIDGSQIKPESIDGGEIKDGSILGTDIGTGVITDVHISAATPINADKIGDGTNNKVFTTAEKTKLGQIHASAQLKILAGQSSVTWTHNYGFTNYAVNVITDHPGVTIYFSNLTVNTIDLKKGQIIGTSIGDFVTSNTGDINLLVTLIPVG